MAELSLEKMTVAHIEEVATVHLAAFDGFFLSFLGKRFLETYYSCIVQFGQIGIVGLSKGRIVGFVAGMENSSGFYTKALLLKGWHFAIAAVPAVARAPRKVLPRLIRAVYKRPSGHGVAPTVPAASLTSIAVRPNSGIRGVGHELMRAFVDECRHRGVARIYLETDAENNDAVNRFYEKEGFAVCRTYVSAEGRRMNEYKLDL